MIYFRFFSKKLYKFGLKFNFTFSFKFINVSGKSLGVCDFLMKEMRNSPNNVNVSIWWIKKFSWCESSGLNHTTMSINTCILCQCIFHVHKEKEMFLPSQHLPCLSDFWHNKGVYLILKEEREGEWPKTSLLKVLKETSFGDKGWSEGSSTRHRSCTFCGLYVSGMLPIFGVLHIKINVFQIAGNSTLRSLWNGKFEQNLSTQVCKFTFIPRMVPFFKFQVKKGGGRLLYVPRVSTVRTRDMSPTSLWSPPITKVADMFLVSQNPMWHNIALQLNANCVKFLMTAFYTTYPLAK